jgi:hypothetical protein
MVGHGYCDRAVGFGPLHQDVAAPPTNLDVSVRGEDQTDLSAGEDAHVKERLFRRG